MTNFIQQGDTLTVTAPYDVLSGGGALVGTIFGVAANDAKSGATDLELTVEGVFDLPKAAGAVTQGAAIHWDDTNKVATTTSTNNTKIGVATQAAASGDATARVRLNGAF